MYVKFEAFYEVTELDLHVRKNGTSYIIIHGHKVQIVGVELQAA
jgi:hypothetical protein